MRAQFGPAGDAYRDSPIHAAGEDLGWLVEAAIDLVGTASDGERSLAAVRALDVATGAGHTAVALARAGADVVASDLTPEMLRATERTVERANRARAASRPSPADGSTVAAPSAGAALPPLRVRTELARAEALPFAASDFDLESCRIAAHHFADPAGFVAEAARVLRPCGALLVIDNIAPADARLADAMNEVERIRDPSHVEAYPVARWVAWGAAAGFDLHALRRWRRRKDAAAWLARSRTPDDRVAELDRVLAAAPDDVLGYLAATWEGDRLTRLEHESALFAFVLHEPPHAEGRNGGPTGDGDPPERRPDPAVPE